MRERKRGRDTHRLSVSVSLYLSMIHMLTSLDKSLTRIVVDMFSIRNRYPPQHLSIRDRERGNESERKGASETESVTESESESERDRASDRKRERERERDRDTQRHCCIET